MDEGITYYQQGNDVNLDREINLDMDFHFSLHLDNAFQSAIHTGNLNYMDMYIHIYIYNIYIVGHTYLITGQSIPNMGQELQLMMEYILFILSYLPIILL